MHMILRFNLQSFDRPGQFHLLVSLLVVLVGIVNNLQISTGSICEPSRQAHPDFLSCPTKTCRQHIDCWVSFGPPQSCVCDRHLCGAVCIPENSRCKPPTAPMRGSVRFNGTDIGEIAQYTCEAGYVVRGPRIRHCLATLSWSGGEPSCSNQTNTCFSPPYMPNTIVRLSPHPEDTQTFLLHPTRDDYKSGDVIHIACQPGFRDPVRDFVEATCVGSEWRVLNLNCERVQCEPISNPTNGRVVYKPDKAYQAEAVSMCSDGFFADCGPMGGKQESTTGCIRVCQADGTWSGQDTVCRPITCPRLDAPENGGISTYSTEVKSIVKIHCNQGYELIGSETMQCLATGKWAGQKAVCKERDCGPVPVIANGQVTAKKNTFGRTANITCDADTTPSSNTDMLHCGLIGNKTAWLPQPLPTCNRHCYLFTVEHGDVMLMHKPNTQSQRFIPITSEDYHQFNFLGNELVTLDGIILPNGRVRHGSQLNVTCHRGYQLITPEQHVTTCMDGVWSVRSKCVPASCRNRPPPIPRARVRFYSRKHGAKGRYECFVGYQLQRNDSKHILPPYSSVRENEDPLGVVRCLHGEWVGPLVRCEPIICPQIVLNNMVHVQFRFPTANPPFAGMADKPEHAPQQGTIAFFHCPTGFHVIGTTFSVCQSGAWSPPPNTAQCEKTTHDRIPVEWFYRIN